MKKFNKSFVSGQTKVQLSGEYGYRMVKEVNETRNLIKVDGLSGSFQRGHIITFTNKANVEMYPAIDDLYLTDQYGSVYERGDRENIFIGKLNGRTLKQFLADKVERETHTYAPQKKVDVELKDGTCGTLYIDADKDPESLCGESVSVVLNDENGNRISARGVVVEILSVEEV
ncbi:hypothetical protein ACOCGZ_003066 [Vibrio cholerae]